MEDKTLIFQVSCLDSLMHESACTIWNTCMMPIMYSVMSALLRLSSVLVFLSNVVYFVLVLHVYLHA